MGALAGRVNGGRQPIAGAHVYLYAAGVGAAGTSSVSLLQAAANGPYSTYSDGTGSYYQLTGSQGQFDLDGEYHCTAGTQLYLYSRGGDAGSGSDNESAGLMAALGECPAGGALPSTLSPIYMTEATTVAAAYALAGFATDATHVWSSGSAQAVVGIRNAFANAAQMVTLSSGAAGASQTTKGGYGTVPYAAVNSLANSLAACVNSVDGSACTSLFGWATADGTAGGMQPVETATAAINIAHYPGTSHVADIWGLAPGIGAPYQQALGSAPNDWTMQLVFSPAGLTKPWTVSVDSQGNVWSANEAGSEGLFKLSSLGVPASGSPFKPTGLNVTFGLAVDGSDNVWATDVESSGALIEVDSNGNALAGSPFTSGGLTEPLSVALDVSGNVWVGNFLNNTVAKFSGSGVADPGSPFTLDPNAQIAIALAASPSGRMYVAPNFGDELTALDSNGSVPVGFPITKTSIIYPQFLAVDADGNVWMPHYKNGEVWKFNTTVTPYGGTTVSGGGMYEPHGVAVDGSNRAWVSDLEATWLLSEYAADGTALTPGTGLGQNPGAGAGTTGGYGTAIDGSGDVWVATWPAGLVEFVGAATPVVTPLATAVKLNKLGQRP
ncbi:MAG: NHL repeat-containing protein [Acidobacteriota bacterium]